MNGAAPAAPAELAFLRDQLGYSAADLAALGASTITPLPPSAPATLSVSSSGSSRGSLSAPSPRRRMAPAHGDFDGLRTAAAAATATVSPPPPSFPRSGNMRRSPYGSLQDLRMLAHLTASTAAPTPVTAAPTITDPPTVTHGSSGSSGQSSPAPRSARSLTSSSTATGPAAPMRPQYQPDYLAVSTVPIPLALAPRALTQLQLSDAYMATYLKATATAAASGATLTVRVDHDDGDFVIQSASAAARRAMQQFLTAAVADAVAVQLNQLPAAVAPPVAITGTAATGTVGSRRSSANGRVLGRPSSVASLTGLPQRPGSVAIPMTAHPYTPSLVAAPGSGRASFMLRGSGSGSGVGSSPSTSTLSLSATTAARSPLDTNNGDEDDDDLPIAVLPPTSVAQSRGISATIAPGIPQMMSPELVSGMLALTVEEDGALTSCSSNSSDTSSDVQETTPLTTPQPEARQVPPPALSLTMPSEAMDSATSRLPVSSLAVPALLDLSQHQHIQQWQQQQQQQQQQRKVPPPRQPLAYGSFPAPSPSPLLPGTSGAQQQQQQQQQQLRPWAARDRSGTPSPPPTTASRHMTAPTLLTPIADLDADADDSSTLASLVVGTRPWMLRSSTPSPPPPQGSGFHRQHHHHHQSHQPHQSHHHHYHRSSVSVPSAPSPAHRGSMVMPSTTMAMAPATATHPHRASMYIGDSGSYGNTSSNGNGGAALTFSDSPFQRQISAYSAASTSTSPRVGAPGGGHQRRASSQMASSTSRPMSYHASIGAHTAYTAFPPPK